MKTKVVVLLSRALIALLLLLSRYFALSRAGIPLGWMLCLGLPITAAGVLFALRRWTPSRAGAPRSTTCNTSPERNCTRRFQLRSPLSQFPSASRSFRPCMPMAPSLTRSTAHGVRRSSRSCAADGVIPARSGEW